MMNTIETVGIRAFQMSIHIFNLFLSRSSWSICLEILTAEFATLVLICLGSAFELISSFAANVTNTIIGIRSPCSNHMSISLRLESSGSWAWMELYRVYMTRFEVRATMIIASKWEWSMKSATSAAKIRQIDGMKRENQNGPDRRCSVMTKLKFSDLTSVEKFVTMYLLRMRDMFNPSPDFPSQ